jgi:hypothetical protein
VNGRIALFVATVTIPFGSIRGQVSMAVAGFVGLAQHRVNVGTGTVQSGGPAPGAMFEARVGSTWDLLVSARQGHLAGDGGGAEGQSIAEISTVLSLAPVRWFSAQLLMTARSLTTSLERQRWSVGALGGELRLPFSGTDALGVVRLALPLVVKVQGLSAPSTAVQAEVGLRYRWRGLSGSLSYDLERYDFPASAGRPRLEELSALTFRVGVPIVTGSR